MTRPLTARAPDARGASRAFTRLTDARPSRTDRPPVGSATGAVMAMLGGIVLSWAFPPLGWWWIAPVGLAGMLVPLIGRSGLAALGIGFLGTAAYFGALIMWATLFLGPIPYGALVVVMALYGAAGAWLIALAYRWLPRVWPGRIGRYVALPAAVAGLWTLREAIASTWPYGGFAWGRVAQSQSASPFGDGVSWLGLSGLSFVIVALTALAIEAVRRRGERERDALAKLARSIRNDRDRGLMHRMRAAGALAIACAIGVLAALPGFPVETNGTIRVGAVQGDTPQAGYFLRGEPGEVFDGHVAATALIDPGEQLDVVLWPEGSVDVSPAYSARVALALSRLSAEYGAPILANTVTVEAGETPDDDRYFNTQFVWEADAGFAQTVDKQHPVPFGEYVPDREFWYSLAPDLVGLIGRGYSPGAGPAVLDVAGVRAGTFICYDIVDDQVIWDAVDAGAEVLFAPTNNADFGMTAEPAQQLAFARMRAMETGRSIVQVSTVGDSAVYGPDGAELASIPWYEPGVMVVDVPLSTTITPAVVFGRTFEVFAAGLGVVLLIGAGLGTRGQARAGA